MNATLTVQFSNIPQYLRVLDCWLVWKYVYIKGEAKPRKVPLYVSGGNRRGEQGSPEDRAKLATYEQALTRYKQGGVDGIGIAMLPDWGLIGLDFDNCVTDGVVLPEVDLLVSDFYAEISPSGKGIRAFMAGQLPDRKSRAEGDIWGFEVFHGKGFLTITGNLLPGLDLLIDLNALPPVSSDILSLYEQRFGASKASYVAIQAKDNFDYFVPRTGLSIDEIKNHLSKLDPSMGQDEGWLKAGMAIHHETVGVEEGFNIWDDWSSAGVQYPGSDALLTRWKSFGKERNARPVTARWLISAAKKQMGTILDPQDYMGMARQFIDRAFHNSEGVTLVRANNTWYAHDGYSYREKDEALVNASAWNWLDTAQKKLKSPEGALGSFNPTRMIVDNLLQATRAQTLVENVKAPCWLPGYTGPNPLELVSLANGLFHIPTRTLHPHTVGFFAVNALPYPWDPIGKPDDWLKFLDDIWPDDEESKNTLQEMFGYLLTPDVSQQKMFLIKGPKRSGKGTIARVLNSLLGHANVCGPSLSTLSGPFGLQSLIDKLVAIVPDARVSGRSDKQGIVEKLLMVSGQDNVTVDRKHNTAWTGTITARFVMFTNEMPQLGDASGALASRFVTLIMTKSFLGNEDLGLTAKLEKELSKIFLWAIEGRDRLQKRGYFLQPKSAAAAVDALGKINSPITAFVEDACELGVGFEVKKDELYDSYRQWCHEDGRTHIIAKDRFCENLLDAVPGLGRSRPWEGSIRVHKFTGLRLKPSYNA